MHIIHQHFATLTSTNDEAKARVVELLPNTLLVITASCQSAGRGTHGKCWISPPAVNLYVTLAFVLMEQQIAPVALSHLLALSTAYTLEGYGVQCQIKLPNDLRIKGRKIAGILCETTPCAQGLGIVLGLGINVNMEEAQIGGINQPATSLLIETGNKHVLGELKERVVVHFLELLARFFQEGFAPFSAALCKRREAIPGGDGPY